MRAAELIGALKRKLRAKTNRDVYKALGMSHVGLINWRRKKRPLTARQVANAIYKARAAAVEDAQLVTIQPIVEYFPLRPKKSSRAARYELFETGKDAHPSQIALRDALADSHGVYVFYDTRGRALYAGKAKEL